MLYLNKNTKYEKVNASVNYIVIKINQYCNNYIKWKIIRMFQTYEVRHCRFSFTVLFTIAILERAARWARPRGSPDTILRHALR